MEKKELDVNGSDLSNSLFFYSYGRFQTIDMFIDQLQVSEYSSDHIHIMYSCFKPLVSLLVPSGLHEDKPTFRAVRLSARQHPIFTP